MLLRMLASKQATERYEGSQSCFAVGVDDLWWSLGPNGPQAMVLELISVITGAER